MAADFQVQESWRVVFAALIWVVVSAAIVSAAWTLVGAWLAVLGAFSCGHMLGLISPLARLERKERRQW